MSRPSIKPALALTVLSLSALAGCQGALVNDCDRAIANQSYNSRCCGLADNNCREGHNGDRESRHREN